MHNLLSEVVTEPHAPPAILQFQLVKGILLRIDAPGFCSDAPCSRLAWHLRKKTSLHGLELDEAPAQLPTALEVPVPYLGILKPLARPLHPRWLGSKRSGRG